MPGTPIEAVTAASIITLVQSIERHGPSAPAAAAFRSALRRKGIEADNIGGLAALDALADAVVAADPDRADARIAIIRAAWADLLPRPGGSARP
ncbi:hypothetical protein MKK67_09775 [Methylobacterium sp. J-072]|uniref:hypothetical protein n=1 Tax=Methylobacterium sp. J-072 TaxID=2836651 RepID=UPI001FBA06D6|nr:hypothetical protein [Methylobacterium sp. J-072]MCJ2092787.1 hypothetical protein [Methylobacterium sp. J-072]